MYEHQLSASYSKRGEANIVQAFGRENCRFYTDGSPRSIIFHGQKAERVQHFDQVVEDFRHLLLRVLDKDKLQGPLNEAMWKWSDNAERICFSTNFESPKCDEWLDQYISAFALVAEPIKEIEKQYVDGIPQGIKYYFWLHDASEEKSWLAITASNNNGQFNWCYISHPMGPPVQVKEKCDLSEWITIPPNACILERAMEGSCPSTKMVSKFLKEAIAQQQDKTSI